MARRRSRHGARGDAWADERRARDARVTAEYGMSAHHSCGRKSRYPTREEAIGHAAARVARGQPFLRAYECPYCGGWHLSSHVHE